MADPKPAPMKFYRSRKDAEAGGAAPLVTVTPDAARQIRVAAKESDAERMELRIAAQRDADGSIDYAMGFDNARKGDLAISSEGISLVVAEADRDLLAGMTLDYVEFEPGDFRFIFINPNDAGDPSPTGAAGDAR